MFHIRLRLSSGAHLIAIDEVHHNLHLLRRLIAVGLVQEVDVILAGGLVQLRLALPPAGPERVDVRTAPGAEHVQPRHGDQHARAGEPAPLLRWHGHRVDHRVVDPVAAAAQEAPRALVPPPNVLVARLRRHGALPPEVGVEQHEAPDGGSAVVAVKAIPPRAQRHVVRDVAAGTVAGQEQPRRVGVARQPGVRPGPGPPRVGERPPECRPRVVVRRREAVLGREVVLNGHGEHPCPGHQRVQVPVVRRREGRLCDERAAVVEHEERQPSTAVVGVRACAVGGEARRQVEAHGEARGSVDDDVPGGDAGGRVRGGWHGVRADESLHEAALVED